MSSGSAGEMATPPPRGDTRAIAREALSLGAPGVKIVRAFMPDLPSDQCNLPRRCLKICALCVTYSNYRGNFALSLFRSLFQRAGPVPKHRLARRRGFVQAPARGQPRRAGKALLISGPGINRQRAQHVYETVERIF